MFNRFKQWRLNRRKKRKSVYYKKGFDYAAGCLLRGEKSVYELKCDAGSIDLDLSGEEGEWYSSGMLSAIDAIYEGKENARS